jgi:chemotaxis protein MotB
VLFDKENSRNPINRRISIIVMTKEADESALKTDAMPEHASAAPGPGTPPASDAPSPVATGATPAGADAPPAGPK